MSLMHFIIFCTKTIQSGRIKTTGLTLSREIDNACRSSLYTVLSNFFCKKLHFQLTEGRTLISMTEINNDIA